VKGTKDGRLLSCGTVADFRSPFDKSSAAEEVKEGRCEHCETWKISGVYF